MPRTNSRKRNNHRSDNSVRVPVASSLSPNAQEFIPTTNNEITTNQREYIPLQPMLLNECSSTPNSSGNVNNSNNSESTSMLSVVSDSLSQKGQRDLLINLLNNSKVDCVICYERAKNVEPIWNCRNCYQIMHLKCIMVWYIKSQRNATWRCPACQNECVGKPTYLCFCGALPNPFSNNVDTPHSCGQVCGLIKKNLNSKYDDCRHKCTLLCHPGPCPQCVVQVLRKCGCEKTEVYVHCGQSTPVVCQNICFRELNCKNHICDKPCHPDKCEPCKENCPQSDDETMQLGDVFSSSNESISIGNATSIQHLWEQYSVPQSAYVTEEELQMLGLNPEELLEREDDDDNNSTGFAEYDDDDVDIDYYDIDDDDDDDDDLVDDLNNDDNETFNHLRSLFNWSNSMNIQIHSELLSAANLNNLMSELSSTSSSSNSNSSNSSSSLLSSNGDEEGNNDDEEGDNDDEEGDNGDEEGNNDDRVRNNTSQEESDYSPFSIERDSENDMDIDESDVSEHSCSWNNSDSIFNNHEVNGRASSSSSQGYSDNSTTSSVSSINYDSNSYSSISDTSSSS